MTIQVRLSAGLAREVGQARLSLTLPAGSTVADLLAQLRARHPGAVSQLDVAIPVIAGQPVSPTASLTAGQEVALLLPIAGGCR